jgi:hypothetical protein
MSVLRVDEIHTISQKLVVQSEKWISDENSTNTPNGCGLLSPRRLALDIWPAKKLHCYLAVEHLHYKWYVIQSHISTIRSITEYFRQQRILRVRG